MEQQSLINNSQSKWTETLHAIVVSLAISVFIYIFIATPNQVDGLSMTPTFEHGELVLTNRTIQWLGGSAIGRALNYDYNRGDVIVFQEPNKPDYIKRIVAKGNDRISLKGGKVFINDTEVNEKYLSSTVRTQGATFLAEGDTRVVPEDSYFVMGDNRGNSQDSRYSEVQFVKREYIKGKVIFRYWPLNHFGVIGTGELEFLETSS